MNTIDGIKLTLRNPTTGRNEDVTFAIGDTFTIEANRIPEDRIGGVVHDTTFPRAVIDSEESHLPEDAVIEPGKSYRVEHEVDEDGNVTAIYPVDVDQDERD